MGKVILSALVGLVIGAVICGALCLHFVGRGLSDALDDNRVLREAITDYQRRIATIQTSVGNSIQGIDASQSGISAVIGGIDTTTGRLENVIENNRRAKAILESLNRVE